MWLRKLATSKEEKIYSYCDDTMIHVQLTTIRVIVYPIAF